jgi:hypothetical protein
MLTHNHNRRFGTKYESRVRPGGQYGRNIPNRDYGCGCSAAEVTPDYWVVKVGKRCTEPEHQQTLRR